MKKLIVSTLTLLFITVNAYALPLSENQKVSAAIVEASLELNKNFGEIKDQVLNNSLSNLSGEEDLDHDTEVIIEHIEKKFPNKSKQQLIALLSSNLLSESGKK